MLSSILAYGFAHRRLIDVCLTCPINITFLLMKQSLYLESIIRSVIETRWPSGIGRCICRWHVALIQLTADQIAVIVKPSAATHMASVARRFIITPRFTYISGRGNHLGKLYWTHRRERRSTAHPAEAVNHFTP